VHEVKYKPSLYFPTLTSGWSELQEYHNIPDNVEVVFGYYGGSIFAITTIREIHDPETFPPFHSRSLFPNETFYFDVHVDDHWLKSPKMVNFINILHILNLFHLDS
jgi:hypothetical protein